MNNRPFHGIATAMRALARDDDVDALRGAQDVVGYAQSNVLATV